jgi:hypothetical protein
MSPTAEHRQISQHVLLRIIVLYLLLTPIVTSFNGLLMHLSGGVSTIGPAFHAICSFFLIVLGLFHPSVEKNYVLIAVFFALIGVTVGVQLLLGFSDQTLTDVGQLYKWYLPLMLFAVYSRWEYIRDPKGQKILGRVFQQLPLIYGGLIILSAASYFVFGFNPTLFPEGTLRFTGFTWGYNSIVNVFFICGYVNYIVFRTSNPAKLINSISFILLNSKTAVVYYALVGWSFIGSRLRSLRLWEKTLIIAFSLPLLAGVLWFGYIQSIRAADSSGDFSARGQKVDAEALIGALTNARFAWYKFVWEDVSDWPAINLLVGNGTNVDRRHLNPIWDEMIGSRWYNGATLDKSDKAIELDVLGHMDMLGVLAASTFAFVFFIYPLLVVKLPHFRCYQIFLIVLSMLGGHLINNPQTGVLVVFFYLFLSARSRSLTITMRSA